MITFETQEDFENAVRKYLEANLRLVTKEITLETGTWGQTDVVICDVRLTL